MSHKSFVPLFFSWVVCQRIDFRKEIDPWCGHNPSFLACDGTHIGVSVKTLNLQSAITSQEVDETVKVQHRKLNRCLLPNPLKSPGETEAAYTLKQQRGARARKFLKGLVQGVLQGESPVYGEGPDSAESLKADLFRVLADLQRSSLTEFLNMFHDRECSPDLLKACARFLDLFTRQNASVSAVLPFRFHEHLLLCCDQMCEGLSFSQTLQDMRVYCQEAADLLQEAAIDNRVNCCTSFLRDLLLFIENMFWDDRDPPEAQEIPGSYNPSLGTSYYFTESGKQLRKLPKYSANAEARVREQAQDKCTKMYPQVSYGGVGYMFLFFCPLHGHCYGFHLIDGAEGRKDPFAALFKFKEEAPKEMFYDNACQLNEYCLSREPKYFQSMRSWHDIFHGMTHKCGLCFKCQRVKGLTSANSEICEQFNSYLKTIKWTGSHLSQTHFMLFGQYMVYLWNKEKTIRFQKIVSVAVGGLR